MVERPDLFGAVVCQVPLIDMARYTQIGAGASWIEEYGDPGDPDVRAAILKYSPYQNVKADVKYPPVFFLTATSDDRVTPVHARKMAAKMEAQGHDVMFFENTDGGHAAAADHRHAAQMWALSFVYLKRSLGFAGMSVLARASCFRESAALSFHRKRASASAKMPAGRADARHHWSRLHASLTRLLRILTPS